MHFLVFKQLLVALHPVLLNARILAERERARRRRRRLTQRTRARRGVRMVRRVQRALARGMRAGRLRPMSRRCGRRAGGGGGGVRGGSASSRARGWSGPRRRRGVLLRPAHQSSQRRRHRRRLLSRNARHLVIDLRVPRLGPLQARELGVLAPVLDGDASKEGVRLGVKPDDSLGPGRPITRRHPAFRQRRQLRLELGVEFVRSKQGQWVRAREGGCQSGALGGVHLPQGLEPSAHPPLHLPSDARRRRLTWAGQAGLGAGGHLRFETLAAGPQRNTLMIGAGIAVENCWIQRRHSGMISSTICP
mmetsp:Transcript_6853/g.13036  ORF Transcript_6853/g.13036 Transcript_6853/m.13036 type:complete len:305 (-) Transcript_6853:155-1069(-)